LRGARRSTTGDERQERDVNANANGEKNRDVSRKRPECLDCRPA
jgi:hypothetical protein